MFRKMRRNRQMLNQEESISILEKMTNGVLAVCGDDGYPYAVPVSYVYSNGKILFHSAISGHKIDAMKRSEKVSFCVVEQDDVKAAEFTTYFRSVIVFGKARIITEREEKLAGLRLLAGKYSPGEAGTDAEIARGINHLHIVEIDIEHLTGKESIELARRSASGNKA